MKKFFHSVGLLTASFLALGTVCSCSDSDEPVAPKPVALDTPGNIRIEATYSSLKVTWTAVENAASYAVQLMDAQNATTDREVEVTETLFENLEELSDYKIRIMALPEADKTEYLDSEWCEWVDARTLQGAITLPSPQNVTATADTHSILVEWEAVENAVAYVVELKDGADNVIEVTAETNSHTFEELEAETDYSVCVGAKGGDELHLDSPKSDWVACRTLEGIVANDFAGGSGTEEDPWQIATPGQLMLMAERVNSTVEEDARYRSDAYLLTADIDLSDRVWTPIGAGAGNENLQMPENNMFSGKFNGNNHTISNLSISMNANEGYVLAGLFGLTQSSDIRNVKLNANTTVLGGPGVEIYAGGLCGIASVYSVIENCQFEGSLSVRPSGSEIVYAAAGGICAVAQGAQLSYCIATISKGNSIVGEGAQTYLGAICGNGNAGSLTLSQAIIEGSIEGHIMPADICNGAVGGMVGNNFGLAIDNSTVEITGTISINGHSAPGSSATAGGICGANSADAVGTVGVTLDGSVTATDAQTVCAAGGIGSQQSAGYGVASINVIAGVDSQIVGTTDLEGSASYVGGVQGRVSYQVPSSTGNCYAEIAGKMESRSIEFAICGGVGGQTVAMTRCHSWIRETARINIESPKNGTFGGVLGNASQGNINACYSIIDGQVTVSGDGLPTAACGGVMGVILGNRTSRRYVTGCYSIIRGTFTAGSGVVATNFGAIAGTRQNAYGTASACYWYCDNGTVQSLYGTMEDVTTRMEDLSETTLNAAAEVMNGYILDYGAYRYDAAQGILVIDAPVQQE